jgi:GT2 family glycosyltransferase
MLVENNNTVASASTGELDRRRASSDLNTVSVQQRSPRVYIVVLNWNGWRDTIECLESVLRLDYPDFKVIVCDNASSDGSMERIRGWARGEVTAECRNPRLASLIDTPVPKPVPFVETGAGDAVSTAEEHAAQLLLIQTGGNLGFAGGHNVALRYVLQQGDYDFAWLLNNDTVVRRDALSQLVRCMQERPGSGICGSTLLYYDDPSKVQACGGSVYSKWFARGGHIGKFCSASRLPEVQEVERQMRYVIGASMLVSRAFLEQIGLLDEHYFLYFEEIDWAVRAKGHFQLAYCPASVVYHKEGTSIGSYRVTAQQSALAEFYGTRNRILFTRKHYASALPSVISAIALSGLHRLAKRRWSNFRALLQGAIQGLTTSIKDGKQT